MLQANGVSLHKTLPALVRLCQRGRDDQPAWWLAGMAGDRGMRYPELTAGALQHLETAGCSDGYSTSRTCEMSLSNHSGINFRGLVYLIDEVTAAH